MRHKTYTIDSTAAQTDGAEVKVQSGQYFVTNGAVPNAGENGSKSKAEESDENEKQAVAIHEIYRYADKWDILLTVVGQVVAVCHGALMILRIVIYGDMADMFIDDATFNNWLDAYWHNITAIYPNASKEEIVDDPGSNLWPILEENNQTELMEELQATVEGDMMEDMSEYATLYAVLGCIALILGYIQVYCTKMAAARQSLRIKNHLFRSILRQDVAWFDTNDNGQLGNRLTDDIERIEIGIGDQASYAVQNFTTFLVGLLVGFIYGWQLTLIMLCSVPILLIIVLSLNKFVASFSLRESEAYAKAGSIAEQALGAMRTVTAFGGQEVESGKYKSNLGDAKALGIRKGAVLGSSMGLAMFTIFFFNALVFGYGCTLVIDEVYTGGDLLVVFFCLLMGATCVGQAAPAIQEFSVARGAAYAIFEIIEREPSIDSSSEDGLILEKAEGNIRFSDVVFRYPSRPDVSVLRGLTFDVLVGQTVALVGSSGCGKSTTVQLLQRFYDTLEGVITLDGHDIRDLNIQWLRRQIGLVSQEPILFDRTIVENIAMGREDATKEDIVAAAKQANAHNFVMELPQQYDTLVGERGAQLSGGQKQRIAIARALVRNPKVLLLDEATSALDNESESIVQAALDKAREGRTTIVIAHRLSTIKNADVIVGIQDGIATETGTHEELMEKQGIYYQLVTNQTKGGGKEFTSSHSPVNSPVSVWSNGKPERAMSVSSNKTVVSEKQAEEEVVSEAAAKRVMRLNAPEWPYLLTGCLGAMVDGCVLPFFAVLMAEIIAIFSLLDEDQMREDARFYSVMFAVLGLLAAVGAFTRSYMFAVSGEELTQRLREMTFAAFLRQDISYFDEPTHSTGALTSRLAIDASAVQGATGSRLSSLCQSLAAVLCGLIIGFVFSWKLTLLVLCFLPFILIAAIIRTRNHYRYRGRQILDKGRGNESSETAGQISTEAIEHIRTVAALTKEQTFHQEYSTIITAKSNAAKKGAHIEALAYGFSESIMYFAMAACYMFGAYLIRNDDLDFHDVFKVFSAMIFSMMSAGQATSFAPDYGKAKMAAARLFAIFDREPPIDVTSEEGKKLEHLQGNIHFHNVQFNYPTRPNVRVLQGANIAVKPGQMVALVGSSGCGKSTIVQLLERFYDPLEGVITVDGHGLKDLHLQWLRYQMGIVSQEPMLFDRSIRENIAYGDNTREVSMPEIVEAAKQANIHNFISALPEGYQTSVGEKGAQLSGGQKQRVAIARALVRNPKILLLDEATSALDTESEKVVQEALDKAQEGRTSIVIAHRLSTIQHADCIVVVNNGAVAELGTHDELLAARGIYYVLQQAQLRKL